MMKRILSVIALLLAFAVLAGTALADYGYTSVDQIPMAYPFTVKVAFDGEGLPHVMTDYPFKDAGADEMNLAYLDRSGKQVCTLNYKYSTNETTIGTQTIDGSKEELYRMIRTGEVTLDDEITINTAHFSRETDWFLIYSAFQEKYVQYSEATQAQSFNGLGEGGVRKSIIFYDGEIDTSWMVKRGENADLMVEYNQYGEIEYASIQRYGQGAPVWYDYDRNWDSRRATWPLKRWRPGAPGPKRRSGIMKPRSSATQRTWRNPRSGCPAAL